LLLVKQQKWLFTWIKAAFNNNATALWWPSWRERETAGHHFGRGPSNVFFQPIYTDYAN
jgi:hypothetical protein